MKMKTTLILLILIVAGAFLFWQGPSLGPLITPHGESAKGPSNSKEPSTLDVLATEFKPATIMRIEVQRGDQTVILTRDEPGKPWTMPGNWPTRGPEVAELVQTVTTQLESRFTPIPLASDADKQKFGLDKPLVTARVTVKLPDGNSDYTLTFGKGKDQKSAKSGQQSNPFSAPTYMRLGDRQEVVRLAPGLVDALMPGPDHYMQRRLFPAGEQAKEAGAQEKVERLALGDVKEIDIKSPTGSYTLALNSGEWEVAAGEVRDRVDPDKVKAIRETLPDVWAEFFVPKSESDLDKCGLKEPEQMLTLKKPDGGQVTLLIGKQSQVKKRTVTRPPPPGLPAPPQQEVINEEYRYAKLKDNDQVFEIKPDRLVKDIFVPVNTLRDARLARFRPEDVRRVEITHIAQASKPESPSKPEGPPAKPDNQSGKPATEPAKPDKPEGQPAKPDNQGGKPATEPAKPEGPAAKPDLQTIVLVKDKDQWRLEKPVQAEAENDRIIDLIDKLSGLQARDKDVIDKADAKTYGFDQPASTVKITVEEEAKADRDNKSKKTKVFTFVLGKHDTDKKKLYVRMEGLERINAVEDGGGENSMLTLVKRPTLAYRALQLWKWQPADVAAIRILKADKEPYVLERKDTGWRITGPFEADALGSLVQPIGTGLTALRCERFETQAAKDLGTYGLDKPYLTLTVTPVKKEGAENKERILLIGKEIEKGPGRFAKLQDSEEVFVIGGTLITAIDKAPLDLLDNHLLSVNQMFIEQVQSKGGAEGPLTLKRGEKGWQVAESPAPAFTADREAIDATLRMWSNLNAQRIAAYGPKADLPHYGLDNPSQTITITLKTLASEPPAQKPAEKVAPPSTHILALGKPVEGSSGERYARLDDGGAIAILPPATVQILTRTYLDFVNPTVLQFDPTAVKSLQRQQGSDTIEFAKKDGDWQMAPANLRADDEELGKVIKQLSALKASRIAAYPAKDPKAFGLDAPAGIWTVVLTGPEDKTTQHVLKIGKEANEKTGDRYVQADGSQAVGVIPGTLAKRLLVAAVAFRNRELAKFADADRILLERGSRKATFAKVDGNWKLTEPTKAEAEQQELEELINAVARFRADELIADKADDLKPYGLDKPTARWRFLSGDKEELSILVGGPEKIKTPDKETDGPRRYAKLANSDVIFLLNPKLTTRLLDEYRSRALWPAPLDAAQVDGIEYRYLRNPFTLEKIDDTWKVAGRPNVQVKPAAVSETLAAISGLRAERFLVDKGADLKLYGLEPPQLVLEIRTPTVKRIIHLGNPEGESKRYYAHIPGEDRSEVFILSEADSGKIVREMAGFVQGGGGQ